MVKRSRELQLQARKAPDGYISLGRFLVLANGTFTPLFGGLESASMSARIYWNYHYFKGWKNERRIAVALSRSRRRSTEAKRLSRPYLP